MTIHWKTRRMFCLLHQIKYRLRSGDRDVHGLKSYGLRNIFGLRGGNGCFFELSLFREYFEKAAAQENFAPLNFDHNGGRLR